MTPNADQIGTNALIHSLWIRGDLGLAWLTFEEAHTRLNARCDELEELGVPAEATALIREFVRKPS